MGSTEDAVIRNLADCLLPAFEHPERANQLFVDHIAMAILAHITQTYGGAAPPKLTKGGLAPWQVRLAKEVLETRLDGKIGLEDLARECGLSRSHFARAFKKSTGKPPHRWLMEQRLGRARELLLKSKLSLAEISDACGFADQSHFTRCFFAATGTVPSEWRRLRRE
jgi:AraC family transcriptional regulator